MTLFGKYTVSLEFLGLAHWKNLTKKPFRKESEIITGLNSKISTLPTVKFTRLGLESLSTRHLSIWMIPKAGSSCLQAFYSLRFAGWLPATEQSTNTIKTMHLIKLL